MKNLARATVVALWLAFVFALLIASGCSTVEGVGRDMQRMAQWTQDKLDNGFERSE